jgi:type II secretory pathway component PulK
MALIRAAKRNPMKDQSGIALFMVLTAISVLALLVTELTFTSQMNQKIAYDGLDEVKALYLAKSGFKLSLLRLKAYLIVKDQVSNLTGGSTSGGKSPVPQSLLNKIWSFPFIFPIPTAIPGLTVGDKDQIDKFQKASGLDGNFTAIIESESSKFNINMILPGFLPPQPSPSPGSSPSPTPSVSPIPTPSTGPSTSPSGQPYNADDARKSLSDYLNTILQNKFIEDPDLQADYRDFILDDFMDALVSWADPSYERKSSGLRDAYPPKRGPFNSVTELRMLPGMDDQLYDFFAPALTVARTPGININTMEAPTLHAILPAQAITDEEVKDFFKFRDDPEQDNTFQSPDDFYTYLKNSVASYKNGGDTAIGNLKADLAKRNIRLITDETEFKITVSATVNQSTRKIEAWVTLIPAAKTNTGSNNSKSPTPTPQPTPSSTPSTGNGEESVPDPGLRITFMRVS